MTRAALILAVLWLSTPSHAGCVEDPSGDGVVGSADIGVIAGAWLQSWASDGWNPLADVNGDGVVGGADIGRVAAVWGRVCASQRVSTGGAGWHSNLGCEGVLGLSGLREALTPGLCITVDVLLPVEVTCDGEPLHTITQIQPGMRNPCPQWPIEE